MNPKSKNFRLFETIDKLGTANVTLSIDPKSRDIIVIKLIPQQKISEADKEELKKNLKIIHKKNNKNIIKIIDFKEDKSNNKKENKIDYIFLEYCNGGDLKNYIKDKYPINESHIQKIIKQLVDSEAIEFMYSKNIIKKVLKLENILINFNQYKNKSKNDELPDKYKYNEKSLDEDFTAKLADLGYSKPENDEEEKKIYNDKLDLLSLGVLTYQLLTGCSPFNKDDQFLPKTLKCSLEIICFINGLLQSEPSKRLNWEQIKKHPFLKGDPDNFYYINLEKVSGNQNNNLIMKFYKSKYLNINIGEIGEKEAENIEFKEKCVEDEMNKKKKEIEEKNALARKEMEKAELERLNKIKEQEKLIKEVNEMEKKKNELMKNKGDDSMTFNKELENINLKIEKIKSDKEIVDDELNNTEEKISEKKEIIENAENSMKNLDNIKSTENELRKLKQEQSQKEKYIKELEEKLQKLQEEKSQKKETKTEDSEDKQKDENIEKLKHKIFIFTNEIIENKKKIDLNKTIIVTTNEKVENYINFGYDNDDIGFIDYNSEKYEIDENYIKERFYKKKK